MRKKLSVTVLLGLIVGLCGSVLATPAAFGDTSEASRPATLQLIADTGGDSSGRYVAVVGEATTYPGAEVRGFPTLAAAQRDATIWTVVDAGAERVRLQIRRASGTIACLSPHSHDVGGTRRPVVITTYCDPAAPEQQLEIGDGALRFRDVPGYELPGAWLSSASAAAGGSQYLLRSTTASSQWVLPSGSDPSPFTARWAFRDEVGQRSLLSGTGVPGAVVTARAGTDAVGEPDVVGSDGRWAIEVPAPDRPGRYDLTVHGTADGIEPWSSDLSLDYGAAVEITTPEDGQDVGSGPVVTEGRGEPGATIVVGFQGGPTITTVVGADGRWSAEVPR